MKPINRKLEQLGFRLIENERRFNERKLEPSRQVLDQLLENYDHQDAN